MNPVSEDHWPTRWRTLRRASIPSDSGCALSNMGVLGSVRGRRLYPRRRSRGLFESWDLNPGPWGQECSPLPSDRSPFGAQVATVGQHDPDVISDSKALDSGSGFSTGGPHALPA